MWGKQRITRATMNERTKWQRATKETTKGENPRENLNVQGSKYYDYMTEIIQTSHTTVFREVSTRISMSQICGDMVQKTQFN